VPGTDLLAAATGDDVSQNVALPFAFNFYGTPYSSANVTTNGFVSFTDLTAQWANSGIPSAATPNTAIYPYWDDLYIDSPTAGIYTASLGVAPSRQFVIEWRNIRYFADASRRVSFEVILNENGDIQTMYQDIAPGDGTEMGNSATVGIENSTGTVGLEYSLNEAVLSTGLAVRYFKPGGGGGNVAPVANPDSASTNEDTAVTVNVLGNDTDANGDPLTVFDIPTPPAHGTASIVAGGIQYTPFADYNGPDTFSYRASDGILQSAPAAVSITVNPVNDAPTVAVALVGGTTSCGSGVGGTIALTVADIDTPLAGLTVNATSSTVKVLANAGLVTGGSGATRSLTATGTGSKGNSTITVTVSDGSLTGSTTVTFRVGGAGKDTLTGGSGPDMLIGLGGNDVLRGNAGIDLLCGGAGNDNLTGGADPDFFSGGDGTDTNTDFVIGTDLGDGT
jgi:hypothetical protein